MSKDILEVFEINTDAPETNRGFYYQYLLVLKKWISNFIENKECSTYVEVDDDIKEIGEELIFTQIKCYTSNFNFNSKEIKNSIFNFFILYLKYNEQNQILRFSFSTNTGISQREKLLKHWSMDLNLENENLKVLCCNKIKEILKNEINTRKNKKLNKINSDVKKALIKEASENLKKLIETEIIVKFVQSISWRFDDLSPEEAISSVTKEIFSLLRNAKFNGKPPTLLFSVMLSEIYKSSQNMEIEERCLKNEDISALLQNTEEELKEFINNKFTKLLNIQIDILRTEIIGIQKKQEIQDYEIRTLKQTVINSATRHLARDINLLPDYNSKNIFGWEEFLFEAKSILESKKTLSVFSEGGMGKTSFAKKFIKTFSDYDHIIWINVEQTINLAFIFDDILIKNLGIEFSSTDNIEQRFRYLINEIKKIEGNNLIVIDVQELETEISSLNTVLSIVNWEKLILTRNHLKIIPSIKLPLICAADALNIFSANCSKNDFSKKMFLEFFEYIDNNILVVELTAKTIENSIDLSLSKFLNSFKEQKLDDDEFNVDIDVNEENTVRIFTFLLKTFSLENLNGIERNYLNFFALLPSKDILIEDIILINGSEYFNENKTKIGNLLNSLEKKGLIEFTSDKKRINIHKMIQDVIIYGERKKMSPFSSNSLHIVYLTNRIAEAYNHPNKSLRFLRYAESVLNSIKVEFRKNLYQPLLLLENELLFAKRFYIRTKDELSKWVEMVKRAENYLDPGDINMGVFYNNLGLSYTDNDDSNSAIIFFEKAISIFKLNELKCFHQIIITSNNISNTYLKEGDLISAVNVFKKVQALRRKYKRFDDQQIGIEYRILAESYALAQDYDKALELLKEGIKLHKSLNPFNRNDFYLSAYHSQLSKIYLLQGNLNESVLHQEIGIKILEEMKLQKSEFLLYMYEALLKLYKYMGLKEKEEQISIKISSFKNQNPI